jgi:hypothetical protein
MVKILPIPFLAGIRMKNLYRGLHQNRKKVKKVQGMGYYLYH